MIQYKAVLLDAGQTLWNMTRTSVQIYHEALESLGVHVALARPEEVFPKVRERLKPASEALETSGVPSEPEQIKAIRIRFNAELSRQLGLDVAGPELLRAVQPGFEFNDELYPDTMPALKALHGSYRLAVVSNGAEQAETCLRLGIDSYFDYIIGSQHVGLRKPMPEIFHMALSALGVGSKEAVMVGDDWEADITGAEGVGIKKLSQKGEAPLPTEPQECACQLYKAQVV
jgi:HAD superfamily hydrolase (TIGR01509 family)